MVEIWGDSASCRSPDFVNEGGPDDFVEEEDFYEFQYSVCNEKMITLTSLISSMDTWMIQLN